MRTASVPLKSVALPTEHGGWGFTLEPLLLGLLLSPGLPTLGLFLLGLLGFLARHPLKLLYQDLRRGKRYPRTDLALKVAGVYLVLALLGFLLAAFTANPSVAQRYEALGVGTKKQVLWSVVSAKRAETRAARIAAIVQRGLAGEPLVP